MTALDGWENFYVLVGSSAGALIGWQFVVMTLLADMPMAQSDAQAGNAFGTPNVVHFGVVLFLSAIVVAPWNSMTIVTVLWGLAGLGGMMYAVVGVWRMRSQTIYRPVFEDWLFYGLFPIAAYAMLILSACAVCSHTRPALFVFGAAVLLLLFIGIRNAWDMVMYHVFVTRRKQREADRDQSA
jgi:hypothetical protein